MIDRDVFTEWMDELDAHFPGERSERVIAVYWRALSERMDTAAFEAACVEMLGSREFFPPWRAFVESVEDTEAAALEAWEKVLEMASDWRGAKPSEVLGPAGRRALRQVGGVKKLAMMDRGDLDFRRRDFLQAYEAGPSPKSRDELPPMSEEGREIVGEAARGSGLRGLDLPRLRDGADGRGMHLLSEGIVTDTKQATEAEVTYRGALDMQVCVPSGWSDERVKTFADRTRPAGTDLGWSIRKAGDDALGGDPERQPCAKRDGFVHVMLDA